MIEAREGFRLVRRLHKDEVVLQMIESEYGVIIATTKRVFCFNGGYLVPIQFEVPLTDPAIDSEPQSV